MTRRRTKEPLPFGQILSSLMKERQLSVRQAAKAAGVSPASIIDWQCGSVPSDLHAVRKLAAALDVSLCFLLIGEEEAKSGPANVTELFTDGGAVFDGFCHLKITRLEPRNAASLKISGGQDDE